MDIPRCISYYKRVISLAFLFDSSENIPISFTARYSSLV